MNDIDTKQLRSIANIVLLICLSIMIVASPIILLPNVQAGLQSDGIPNRKFVFITGFCQGYPVVGDTYNPTERYSRIIEMLEEIGYSSSDFIPFSYVSAIKTS